MKIANPIYDSAFKYLMRDKIIAQHFISTLLSRDIELNSFDQTESAYISTHRESGFVSQRMDFHATITEADGRKRKVLIELQKSLIIDDVARFRKYLGSAYYDPDITQKNAEYQEIITVYILGFHIGTSVPVVRTSTQLIDVNTQEILKNESTDDYSFIRRLHHQSVFIDTTLLSDKMNTRLERLLAVFNQQFISQQKHVLELPEDLVDSEYKNNNQEYRMMHLLNQALQSKEIRAQMIDQEEFEYALNDKLDEAKQEGLTEGLTQGVAKGEKKAKLEVAETMLKNGLSIEQISTFTSLSTHDIENIQNIVNKKLST